ncbi:hypothetical protein PV08_04322 [Exophiala spinifera]|uniref:Zn(2)-C6 fungal-type domain-containing protein n=1 Tax=Exophiala spinifera TaxID=91928 RepID=A0A0D1YPK7_9EURO|nr:uncharacterized protein PV08_04322 [Exophiala spinifera]KIW17131.1 hypothetical protein PV08_04322 [Exophiala spinifera]
MTNGVSRACARCHAKKIKCDGTLNCKNCFDARAPCEPYTRLRRIELHKNTQARLAWLEDELSSIFSVDCSLVETGTPLEPVIRASRSNSAALYSPSAHASQREHNPGTAVPGSHHASQQDDGVGNTNANIDAPETGLLALNATGELRYLGPSSGSFFANYAASLARSCVRSQGVRNHPSSTTSEQIRHERTVTVANVHQVLFPDTIRLLTHSFRIWTLPLYPLFSNQDLNSLVAQYENLQTNPQIEQREHTRDLILFYLVMALGSINASHTMKQCPSVSPNATHAAPSASLLYAKALELFEHDVQHLRPSVSLIQILLLISIFSSYGPSGFSQWQLAGLAMRMTLELGLHCFHVRTPNHDSDRRNRVFWTMYVIEISLAYNLGRPPSIVNDHITAPLPVSTDKSALALHYIRHRQIQNKLIALVYRTNPPKGLSSADGARIIQDLQAELDDWKTQLQQLHQQEPNSAYPPCYWERLYHGTTFVLHRSSPLCPKPSSESAVRCIQSAGTYVDNVLTVLRTSNVPLTWMLVQGVLFAGLTMLVTARTTTSELVQRADATIWLVNFANWTRKCSMCIAIMNERWSEDLLSRLDAQFEALASDTLKMVAGSLTNRSGSTETFQTSVSTLDPTNNIADPTSWPGDVSATYIDLPMPADLGSLDPFSDLLGFDNGQAFWNFFPSQSGFDVLDALGPEQYHRDESQTWADMFS